MEKKRLSKRKIIYGFKLLALLAGLLLIFLFLKFPKSAWAPKSEPFQAVEETKFTEDEAELTESEPELVESEAELTENELELVASEPELAESEPEPWPTPNPPAATSNKILLPVPFTTQAPLADWQDPRQQDACEEASVLMAIKWARGEELSRQTALTEILAASDYLQEKYGEYRDTALPEVLAWLINDYFNFTQAQLIENVSLTDLISQLAQGRVIIAPMNGQALKNPNFTAPGPINHMVLIRGYNPETKVFITNDPGTRNGELYEYPENILYSALRTYPTGYHETNDQPQKNIIVLWQ